MHWIRERDWFLLCARSQLPVRHGQHRAAIAQLDFMNLIIGTQLYSKHMIIYCEMIYPLLSPPFELEHTRELCTKKGKLLELIIFERLLKLEFID
jgi:hypothetical protein